MYNVTDLSALLDVSPAVIRRALRTLGRGVGQAGTYVFTQEEINDVVDELKVLLKKDLLGEPLEVEVEQGGVRGRVAQLFADHKNLINNVLMVVGFIVVVFLLASAV